MHAPTERPLTPWAKTGLIVSTAGIIILFYAFTLVAAIILLVILAVENYLATLGSWVTVAQGAIFVLCVLTFRPGIIGELARFLGKPL